MTRIKALGLALVAVFAMGALASSAMASPALEGGAANVNLNGEQAAGTNDVLTIEGTSVECANATYNPIGTTSNGATNAEAHPEYAGCTAFGFLNANIETTNCNFRSMANGTFNNLNERYTSGELQITCNTNPIKIIAGNCTVTIGSQTLNAGFGFTNTTNSPMDFDVNTTNSSLTVTVTVSNFPCSINVGVKTATWNSTTTYRAFDPVNKAQLNATIVG